MLVTLLHYENHSLKNLHKKHEPILADGTIMLIKEIAHF